MRVAILFLILLNAAFFYWANEKDFSQEIYANTAAVPGFEPIELLSERSKNFDAQQNKNSAANTTVASLNVNRQLVCFSVGPFEQLVASNEVYEILLDSGIDAKQRSVQERQPKSYWVYLSPHESLTEAKATVAFLENNNIREYYIMPEPPEHEHAISLGLYEKLDAARSKLAEIKNLKLDPKMEVRFNEHTQYWVDFRQYNDSAQPNVLEDLLRKNDRMLVLESKCI